ncbi:protein TonB [Sphingomonas jejuensis]|uniref:Protein TonB n=1 Tax=Sphingomonas jejuensis TaxID=904715 RepID=A0ABX0XHC3_9SPHN|nr:energy transducer TonB [Sphingomonas jejuensis]NJC32726.1 protein TonB [Sphingomonas jejuensis]
MPYADHHATSRTRSLALVAIVHVGVGYALLTGLAGSFIIDDAPPTLQTSNIPIAPPPPPQQPEPVQRQQEAPRPAEPISVPLPRIQPPSPNQTLTTTELPPLRPTPLPEVTGNGTGTAPEVLPPVEQTIVRSAAAKGNPAAWISDADYPARALREERSGTSSIRWEISTAGRVENCTVVASSGSPDLDRAACQAITRRGRYDPALDATGAPIRSSASRRVVWRIPAE